MILQDLTIIWLCDFMGRSEWKYVIIMPSFVAIGIVVMGI